MEHVGISRNLWLISLEKIDRFLMRYYFFFHRFILNFLNFYFLLTLLDFLLFFILFLLHFTVSLIILLFLFEFGYLSFCTIHFYYSFCGRLIKTKFLPCIFDFHSFHLDFLYKYLTSLN